MDSIKHALRPRGAHARALAALAVAALSVAAVASASTQPFAGTYEGVAKGTKDHNKGQGCFVEKPTVFGKRVKPANGDGTICNNEIIAPSLGPVKGVKKGCNAKPASLNSGGFPIRQAGFHYKGKAKIGPHGKSLKVDFQGHWITRYKVKGTTKISGGGCTSNVNWTMSTPAP